MLQDWADMIEKGQFSEKVSADVIEDDAVTLSVERRAMGAGTGGLLRAIWFVNPIGSARLKCCARA